MFLRSPRGEVGSEWKFLKMPKSSLFLLRQNMTWNMIMIYVNSFLGPIRHSFKYTMDKIRKKKNQRNNSRTERGKVCMIDCQMRARRALMMFCWEPEGRYHCIKSMAIAPLCFSKKHCWRVLINTLLQLSADDMRK